MSLPSGYALFNDTPALTNATTIIVGLSEVGVDVVSERLGRGGVAVCGPGSSPGNFSTATFAPRWPALRHSAPPSALAFRLPRITRYIDQRNKRFDTWAIASPLLVPFLARFGIGLFRAPRLVVILRDPLETVASTGTPSQGRLRAVAKSLDLLLRIARTSKCPTFVASHDFLMSERASFEQVLDQFCALNSISAAPAAPSSNGLDKRGMGPAVPGHLVFHDRRTSTSDPADGRTVVVSGPPRSGTSMVAAALHAAGLPLGHNVNPASFENPRQIDAFSQNKARIDLKTSLRQFRHFRLARAGFDMAAIKDLIAARRSETRVWGFKRPNIMPFISKGGLRLLDKPILVLTFRDPLAIARRIAIAHGMDVAVGLAFAHRDIISNLEVAYRSKIPTLLISHGSAKRDFAGFLDRLYGFCDLDVDRQRYPEIIQLCGTAQEKYLQAASGPMVGRIRGYVGGMLRGWAKLPNETMPVTVEVFAADKRLISSLADKVEAQGSRVEGHGFDVDLRPFSLDEQTPIRVMIASTNQELRNSGRTLRELRPRPKAASKNASQ